MNQASRSELAKVFLLGVIAALVAVAVFQPEAVRINAADSSSSGGLIALTVQGKKDVKLFVIDTVSKYLAVYAVDTSDRLIFQSARKIQQDLRIEEMNKKSGMSVKEAEKEAKND